MNIFYLFDLYFNKLDDFKFKKRYESILQRRLKLVILIIFLLWIIITIAIGTLFINLIGAFFGFIFMLFFSGYLVYLFVFQFLQFLAKQNARYLSVRNLKESTFSKDDVVETIRK